LIYRSHLVILFKCAQIFFHDFIIFMLASFIESKNWGNFILLLEWLEHEKSEKSDHRLLMILVLDLTFIIEYRLKIILSYVIFSFEDSLWFSWQDSILLLTYSWSSMEPVILLRCCLLDLRSCVSQPSKFVLYLPLPYCSWSYLSLASLYGVTERFSG
jgi:hypothetical protein